MKQINVWRVVALSDAMDYANMITIVSSF